MVISTTIQHALRALGYLATVPDGEWTFGRDLAEKAEVPVSYLSKIMNILGKAGLVEATRGTRGGYRLARPAPEISLAEVFDAMEPGAVASSCFLHEQRKCSSEDACPIHGQWKLVRESFESFLASSSVADVAPALERLEET